MTYIFLSMITIIICCMIYSNAPAGSGLHSVTLLLLSTVVCVCRQSDSVKMNSVVSARCHIECALLPIQRLSQLRALLERIRQVLPTDDCNQLLLQCQQLYVTISGVSLLHTVLPLLLTLLSGSAQNNNITLCLRYITVLLKHYIFASLNP